MSEMYLLVEEVASETRSCVATVRYWIRTGKLKAIRIGRRLLVPRTNLDSLIENSPSNPIELKPTAPMPEPEEVGQ